MVELVNDYIILI